MVELSSKFGALPGEAVDLIAFAHNNKLQVEGLSFHVGSQCTNVQNYIQALHLAAGIFSEAKDRGFDLKLLDIGGGFLPTTMTPFLRSRAWPKQSTPNWTAFFPSRLRFSPSRGASWSPLPPPPSRKSSARLSVAASSATISMTASTTPTAA